MASDGGAGEAAPSAEQTEPDDGLQRLASGFMEEDPSSRFGRVSRVQRWAARVVCSHWVPLLHAACWPQVGPWAPPALPPAGWGAIGLWVHGGRPARGHPSFPPTHGRWQQLRAPTPPADADSYPGCARCPHAARSSSRCWAAAPSRSCTKPSTPKRVRGASCTLCLGPRRAGSAVRLAGCPAAAAHPPRVCEAPPSPHPCLPGPTPQARRWRGTRCV
jgi:hypothetical protein